MGDIIGGAAQMKEADVKAQQAKRERELQDRAYKQAERRYGKGLEMLGQGEQALYSETAASPEELEAIKKDIIEGGTAAQQQARGEMGVALEQQGVRGPQAAILRGRQAGSLSKGMMSDINKLAYEDALRRREARTGFQTSKALGGLSAAGSV